MIISPKNLQREREEHECAQDTARAGGEEAEYQSRL